MAGAEGSGSGVHVPPLHICTLRTGGPRVGSKPSQQLTALVKRAVSMGSVVIPLGILPT